RLSVVEDDEVFFAEITDGAAGFVEDNHGHEDGVDVDAEYVAAVVYGGQRGGDVGGLGGRGRRIRWRICHRSRGCGRRGGFGNCFSTARRRVRSGAGGAGRLGACGFVHD